jgi:hypothetical protein
MSDGDRGVQVHSSKSKLFFQIPNFCSTFFSITLHALSRIDDPPPSFIQSSTTSEPYNGPPRNVENINTISFDKALQPKKYEILGTHPESKILFTDVNILDSTGRDQYRGDVLIKGGRITKAGVVPNVEELKKDPKVRVFQGRGRTLMSGLGDAHTHFT